MSSSAGNLGPIFTSKVPITNSGFPYKIDMSVKRSTFHKRAKQGREVVKDGNELTSVGNETDASSNKEETGASLRDVVTAIIGSRMGCERSSPC